MDIHGKDVFGLADIINKVLKGEATAEEMRQYEQWLASDPGNRELIDKATDGPTIARRYRERERLDPEKSLHRISDKATGQRRKKRISRLIPYAAAISAVTVVAAFYLMYPQKSAITDWFSDTEEGPTLTIGTGEKFRLLGENDSRVIDRLNIVVNEETGISYVDVAVDSMAAEPVIHKLDIPTGYTYHMMLPDGSRVWLNTRTQLSYTIPFSKDSRTVVLSGEAYFEVAEDEERPFRVIANGTKVAVLGTRFNVMAYEDEPSVTTTLVEGSVEVMANGCSTMLAPGQQAVVADGADGISVHKVDPMVYTSWMTGVFTFENMTLADICNRLSRWYDVEFSFEGDTGNEKFSGGTWMNAPLRDFLDNIELVTDVIFYGRGDKITVKPR